MKARCRLTCRVYQGSSYASHPYTLKLLGLEGYSMSLSRRHLRTGLRETLHDAGFALTPDYDPYRPTEEEDDFLWEDT